MTCTAFTAPEANAEMVQVACAPPPDRDKNRSRGADVYPLPPAVTLTDATLKITSAVAVALPEIDTEGVDV
jgi:hypothetical protein